MFETEKIIEPDITLVCKLSKDGIIKFVNKNYIDITSFSEEDLIGQSNEIIQHPKMPQVILEKAWDAIYNGKQLYLVSKNITKNGAYFWTIADINSRVTEGKSTAVFVRRKYLPSELKHEFSTLYEILYGIESNGGGKKVAEKYLSGWLENKNTNYQDYIINSFGGKKNIKQYMTSEVSDKELFSTDPSDMNIDDVLKFLKKKKKRFWGF